MKRDYEGKEDPDMTDGVVVLLALVFFLFMALLLIILCIYAILRKRTYMELPLPRSNRPWAQRLSSSSSISEDRHLRSGALDVKIIEALPIFVYTSSVERFKLGLSGTDCSVCLQDFEEREKVRVLPDCKHTFHTGCIDMWFHSHSNCPLCRTKVEATIEEGAPDASNGVENVVTDMDFVMEQGHNSSSFTSETFAEMGINSAPEINNLQPEEICSPSGSRFCRLHSLKRILSGRSRDGRVFPSTQNDEIEEFL